MKILENKKIIIGVFVVLSIITLSSIGLSIYLYNKDTNEEVLFDNVIATTYEEENVKEVLNSFFVEVKGAVKKPGVYEVNKNNIINDVIKLAGGFKSNAYTNNINLSKKVSSEMVIYVFTRYEYSKNNIKKEEITNNNSNDTQSSNNVNNKKPESNNNCTTTSYDLDNCIEDGSSVIVSDDNKDNEDTSNENDNTNTNEEVENKLININTASLEELCNIPGVGEKKAKCIIEYRETNGLFNSIEDIKNVSGIGDATYEKFKDYITV